MSYTNGLDKPSDYFNTVLRSGLYGGSDTAFTVGFEPDLIWDKRRSGTSVHALFDSSRGFGSSGKVLYSNNTDAEATNGLIDAVSSTGFTIKASSDNTGTLVDWCWKKQAGIFDIVSYTGNGSGRTISHNLGSVPSFMIVKNRDAARSWNVYFGDPTDYIYLNDTAAAADYNEIWNDTAPTASVFSVGTDNGVNQSSEKYIAYLFGNKQGVSSAGTYVGNGSSSGAYIHLGFKASFFMMRNIGSGNNWHIMDHKRDPDNAVEQLLKANASDAENTTSGKMDFLSSGVKIRSTSTGANGSGATFIYLAFAENPFVTSSGTPTTAR